VFVPESKSSVSMGKDM
jgi:hypothetical protein